MILSATENAIDAFLITIARGIVILVPLVLILSKAFNMTGVWLAFVITELIVTILAIYLMTRRKRSLGRQIT
jgi:Na+-driven multidrug efflux pump